LRSSGSEDYSSWKRRWRDEQCQFVYKVIDGGKAMELMLKYYDLIEQLIWIGGLFDWMIVG
jgi:hypothetical protein